MSRHSEKKEKLLISAQPGGPLASALEVPGPD